MRIAAALLLITLSLSGWSGQPLATLDIGRVYLYMPFHRLSVGRTEDLSRAR